MVNRGEGQENKKINKKKWLGFTWINQILPWF